MCRMQSPRLAAVEAFSQVMRVPEVEVADLRALDAHNSEEMSHLHLECLGVTRRRTMANARPNTSAPAVPRAAQRRPEVASCMRISSCSSSSEGRQRPIVDNSYKRFAASQSAQS